MVATAAHLVDALIPRVPMRQWVLSLLKRYGQHYALKVLTRNTQRPPPTTAS
ncbi:MAG: hypothetical protein ACMG50_01545 [Thermomonas sp.]